MSVEFRHRGIDVIEGAWHAVPLHKLLEILKRSAEGPSPFAGGLGVSPHFLKSPKLIG